MGLLFLYCNDCDLCLSNKFTPVSGRGDNKAKLLFIGEAPGINERKKNTPFIGASGKLLQRFIDKYGFTDKCFITNAVKCRPSGNRTPTEHEIITCNKYLLHEIETLKPNIIVLLGNTAVQAYYHTYIPISKLSSKFIENNNLLLCFLYHPSSILRNQHYGIHYKIIFDKILDYYRKHIDYLHLTY